MSGAGRMIARPLLGFVPFLAIAALWWAAPHLFNYPAYMLPTVAEVGRRFVEMVVSGELFNAVVASLGRLLGGFIIGNLIAIPLAIAMAMNARMARIVMPVAVFLQAVAGIAWAPLAVIWFGIGNTAVTFLVVNSVFFSSFYNTISGVQSIAPVLWRAVRSMGASPWQMMRELILPGAMVQLLLGLRTSMALGWRALVAAELIIGTNGIGFLMMDATKWYGTDTIICGILIIGLLWLAFDRFVFAPVEWRTVRRWGLIGDN
jgi:NitT/TauT family transport system permease protein/taurine transport system permease protein